MQVNNQFFCIGKILKPFGYKGQFVAAFEVDNAEKYTELEFVFVEIKHERVPFFVSEFEMQRNNSAILKLDYIDDMDALQKVIGCRLLIPESDVVASEPGEFDIRDLQGFTVIDEKYGNIGSINKVLEFPQQHIMQIFFREKEILIPLTDDFITEIDPDKKIITIVAPEGLIGFYLE